MSGDLSYQAGRLQAALQVASASCDELVEAVFLNKNQLSLGHAQRIRQHLIDAYVAIDRIEKDLQS